MLYNYNGLLSLKLAQTRITQNDARPISPIKYLNFDTQTGKTLLLADLFKPAYEATLRKLIQQKILAENCFKYLVPGGKLIITVPSPQVDQILEILLKLKLIEGMSLEEHYGYKPEDTEHIFAAPLFKMVKKEKFQFGLNNLFVFERI